mgnify:CR=1 FL=1
MDIIETGVKAEIDIYNTGKKIIIKRDQNMMEIIIGIQEHRN